MSDKEPEIVADLPPEEIIARAPQEVKDVYLLVYACLVKYKRFRDFVDENFHIALIQDPETKKSIVQVIEKPVKETEPEVRPLKASADQMIKLQGILGLFGVKNTVDAVKAVLKVFGQEQSALITSGDVSFDKLKKLD